MSKLAPWKLSPSKFHFGFDNCQRCYYLDIKEGITQPGSFPGVFSKLDSTNHILRASEESMIKGLMSECSSIDLRVSKLEKESENIGQPDEATDQEFNEFSEMIGGHSSQITQISENQQGIQEQLDKIQTALQNHGITIQ